jgi:hypothetical protein
MSGIADLSGVSAMLHHQEGIHARLVIHVEFEDDKVGIRCDVVSLR